MCEWIYIWELIVPHTHNVHKVSSVYHSVCGLPLRSILFYKRWHFTLRIQCSDSKWTCCWPAFTSIYDSSDKTTCLMYIYYIYLIRFLMSVLCTVYTCICLQYVLGKVFMCMWYKIIFKNPLFDLKYFKTALDLQHFGL